MLRRLSILFTFLCLHDALGKVHRPHGNWNRPFALTPQLTVEEYLQLLSLRVKEAFAENGLNIKLEDSTFDIENTMLGVTLKGQVTFGNGLVSNSGNVKKGIYAPEANRTLDLTEGFINLNLRLTTLSTIHDLKTTMNNKDITGSVESTFTDIHFFFKLTQLFSTAKNSIEALSIGFIDASWTIKPRDVNTYIIEETLKRDNTTVDWYKESLIKWQRDVMAPLILQQSEGLPFPIDPY